VRLVVEIEQGERCVSSEDEEFSGLREIINFIKGWSPSSKYVSKATFKVDFGDCYLLVADKHFILGEPMGTRWYITVEDLSGKEVK